MKSSRLQTDPENWLKRPIRDCVTQNVYSSRVAIAISGSTWDILSRKLLNSDVHLSYFLANGNFYNYYFEEFTLRRGALLVNCKYGDLCMNEWVDFLGCVIHFCWFFTCNDDDDDDDDDDTNHWLNGDSDRSAYAISVSEWKGHCFFVLRVCLELKWVPYHFLCIPRLQLI